MSNDINYVENIFLLLFDLIYFFSSAFITLLLYMLLFTDSSFVSYKSRRELGNTILINVILFCCIYWGFIFTEWYSIFKKFPLIFNIIFILITTLIYSSLISLIDFLINLNNPKAYFKNDLRIKEINLKSKKIYLERIKKINSILSACKKINQNSRPLEFKYIGFNGKTDGKYPNKLKSGYFNYQINNSKIFLNINLRWWASRSGEYLNSDYYLVIANNYFNYDSNLIYNSITQIEKIKFDEDDIYSFIKKIEEEYSLNKKYEEQIKNNEASIPLGDFIFNNMILLLNVGNPIIFPNSRIAKSVRLILGVIKFLVLGILIMLFIK